MSLGTSLGDLYVNIRADLSQIGADLARAKTEAERTGGVMAGALDKTTAAAQRAGGALARIKLGGVLVGAAFGVQQVGAQLQQMTAGLAQALGTAVTQGAQFEATMNSVAAVTGAAGASFRALEQQALQLGATTKFTASQAAEGMQFLGMAGFRANQIIGAMPGTLALAAAGAMDLGRAADIQSNILTGFGLAAAEAGRVADVSAYAMARANTNVEQLGHAMKFVAPVASTLGVSLEETTAMVMALSDAGLQSSLAGTGLRRVLSELASPSDKTREILDALGVSLNGIPPGISQIAAIGTEGFVQLLGSIELTAEELDELQRAGIDAGDALEVFGDRGGPAALVLAKSLEKVVGHMEAMGPAGQGIVGFAKNIERIQMRGLQGALIEMRSAMEGFAIQMSRSGVSKTLEVLTDSITSVVRAANALPKPILAAMAAFGGVLAIVGPLTLTAGALLGVVGAAVAAGPAIAGLVGGGLAALGAALGPIAIGIAAVTAAVVIGTAVWNRYGADISRFASTAGRALVNLFPTVGPALASFASSVGETWTQLGTALARFVEGDWQAAGAALAASLRASAGTLPRALDAMFPGLANQLRQFSDQLSRGVRIGLDLSIDVARRMAPGIVAAIETAFTVLPSAIAPWLDRAAADLEAWGERQLGWATRWQGQLAAAITGALMVATASPAAVTILPSLETAIDTAFEVQVRPAWDAASLDQLQADLDQLSQFDLDRLRGDIAPGPIDLRAADLTDRLRDALAEAERIEAQFAALDYAPAQLYDWDGLRREIGATADAMMALIQVEDQQAGPMQAPELDPPQIDFDDGSLARDRDAALGILDDITRAHLEALGDRERIIELDRDAQLGALDEIAARAKELGLDLEQIAEARIQVEAVALGKIIDLHAEADAELARLADEAAKARADAAAEIAAAYARVFGALAPAADPVRDVADAAGAAIDNLGDALANAATGAENLGDSLKRMLADFLRDLMRAQLDQMILDPLRGIVRDVIGINMPGAPPKPSAAGAAGAAASGAVAGAAGAATAAAGESVITAAAQRLGATLTNAGSLLAGALTSGAQLVGRALSGLFDGLTSVLGRLGGGLLGGVGAGLSSIFAGFFAKGGAIPAGKVGVTGEAGPELIRGPATVIPIGKAASAAITAAGLGLTGVAAKPPPMVEPAAVRAAEPAVTVPPIVIESAAPDVSLPPPIVDVAPSLETSPPIVDVSPVVVPPAVAEVFVDPPPEPPPAPRPRRTAAPAPVVNVTPPDVRVPASPALTPSPRPPRIAPPVVNVASPDIRLPTPAPLAPVRRLARPDAPPPVVFSPTMERPAPAPMPPQAVAPIRVPADAAPAAAARLDPPRLDAPIAPARLESPRAPMAFAPETARPLHVPTPAAAPSLAPQSQPTLHLPSAPRLDRPRVQQQPPALRPPREIPRDLGGDRRVDFRPVTHITIQGGEDRDMMAQLRRELDRRDRDHLRMIDERERRARERERFSAP